MMPALTTVFKAMLRADEERSEYLAWLSLERSMKRKYDYPQVMYSRRSRQWLKFKKNFARRMREVE